MSRESLIEVVGGETIGGKAEMLKEHQSLIEQVGLSLPPTVVIASETVDVNSGYEPPNRATTDLLNFAGRRFSDMPALAIRSSAEGDAVGNGVYISRFATNEPYSLEREAAKVIGSFASSHAQDFRRQGEFGDTFALMVQPVIGQVIERAKHGDDFGPYLSGFGYTTSRNHADGYTNITAGIGGGVSRSGGMILDPEFIGSVYQGSIIAKHYKKPGDPLTFFEILQSINEAISEGVVDDQENDFRWKKSMWAVNYASVARRDSAKADFLVKPAHSGIFYFQESGFINGENPTFLSVLKSFMPQDLLGTMKQAEEIAGYPLYYEWALKTDEETGNSVPIILQIAPAEISGRTMLENKINGEIVAEARNLCGHGEKSSDTVVVVTNNFGIEALTRFNRDRSNEGYIVIFHSGLASSRNLNQIQYSDISNAGIILEIPSENQLDTHAGRNIAQHLFGATRQTGKFIGDFPTAQNLPELWRRVMNIGQKWTIQDEYYRQIEGTDPSLHILKGEFSVYADETTCKITVVDNSK